MTMTLPNSTTSANPMGGMAMPVVSARADWERSLQIYGLCEATRDPSKPGQAEKQFAQWAMKRRLPVVEGERLVAFDSKAFNPKDSLNKERFGFLLRYARPRSESDFVRDVTVTLAVRSPYIAQAIKMYWTEERVLSSVSGNVQADHEMLRLMGFSYHDLCLALDGVVRTDYLALVSGKLEGVNNAMQLGSYIVDFDTVKERFFDAAFLLNAAGQPVPLSQIGAQMGVDHIEDVRVILREARQRFNLNVEVNDTHAMFGAPSQQAMDALIVREKNNKKQLEQTETVLRDRLKTITGMIGHYNKRETQILNENETLRDEGRTLWIKAKMVTGATAQMTNKRGGR